MRTRTSASQACGSTPFILAVMKAGTEGLRSDIAAQRAHNAEERFWSLEGLRQRRQSQLSRRCAQHNHDATTLETSGHRK